jgi:hypothetical protein
MTPLEWAIGLSCCAVVVGLLFVPDDYCDGNVGPESDDVIEARKWLRWLKKGRVG